MSDDRTTYRALVNEAKRKIIQSALIMHSGNRTETAKALGLQRTYLVALIRSLAVYDCDTPAHS